MQHISSYWRPSPTSISDRFPVTRDTQGWHCTLRSPPAALHQRCCRAHTHARALPLSSHFPGPHCRSSVQLTSARLAFQVQVLSNEKRKKRISSINSAPNLPPCSKTSSAASTAAASFGRLPLSRKITTKYQDQVQNKLPDCCTLYRGGCSPDLTALGCQSSHRQQLLLPSVPAGSQSRQVRWRSQLGSFTPFCSFLQTFSSWENSVCVEGKARTLNSLLCWEKLR